MLSIILPAKNEASQLKILLPELLSKYPDEEIIVVNDGSTDDTIEVCEKNNVKIVTHPYSKGNGASIKTGAKAATGEILVFMDADGQHSVNDISLLLEKYHKGYHMVVGSRTLKTQANLWRGIANKAYNLLASWIVGHTILDLTSGFRVVNAMKFRKFLYLLPNGFSYPTTITMSFFRIGYTVGYVPVNVASRNGKSHIRLFRDGARFFLIIFKVGTLYSPLKLFFPISLVCFFTGVGYYIYTYSIQGRFTNMSALLLITSMLVFLIGLVSEQITSLLYSKEDN